MKQWYFTGFNQLHYSFFFYKQSPRGLVVSKRGAGGVFGTRCFISAVAAAVVCNNRWLSVFPLIWAQSRKKNPSSRRQKAAAVVWSQQLLDSGFKVGVGFLCECKLLNISRLVMHLCTEWDGERWRNKFEHWMKEEEEEEEIVEDVAAERFRWVGMLEVVDRRLCSWAMKVCFIGGLSALAVICYLKREQLLTSCPPVRNTQTVSARRTRIRSNTSVSSVREVSKASPRTETTWKLRVMWSEVLAAVASVLTSCSTDSDHLPTGWATLAKLA